MFSHEMLKNQFSNTGIGCQSFRSRLRSLASVTITTKLGARDPTACVQGPQLASTPSVKAVFTLETGLPY